MHSPNLLELSAIEERLLLARLEAVRLAISHAGEKGRELEAEALGLSESDRAELLPSGVQTVYKNRAGWAHDRLKRSGLSTSLKRGFWKLTEAGGAFAAAHPGALPEEGRAP